MEDTEAGTDGSLAIALHVIRETDTRFQQLVAVRVQLPARARAYRSEAEVAGGGKRRRGVAVEIGKVAIAFKRHTVELITEPQVRGELRSDLPVVLEKDSPLTLHEACEVGRTARACTVEELIFGVVGNRPLRSPRSGPADSGSWERLDRTHTTACCIR